MKLLDPANIPVFTGNLELLESYIGALRKDAARLRATGSDIHSRFQGLAAHYRAPEAEQLFATTLPVRERAHAFAAKLDKVAGALSDYAAEARPLAHKLAALSLEAETFLMSVEGDDRWKHDSKKTDHHNRILDDITAAQAAFQDAERRCASKITALVGGPRFVTDDGTHKPNMYGYDAETLAHAKLPWGDPVEREYDWYEPHSIKSFAWDGVVVDGIGGTFKGLGTLVGVDGWDKMGQAWSGLGKTAVGAFMYGSGAYEIPDDYLPQFFKDSKRAARDTAKALVAYDEWDKDPARAAGAASFNILTTATGTGALAKGGAGAAAKVVNAVGKAGRIIDPMTYVAKGTGFVVGKSLAKLSTALPAAGDLVNTLRDHLPGTERLPDGSVRLPDASVLPGRARYLRPDGALVDVRGRGVRGHVPVHTEAGGAELRGAQKLEGKVSADHGRRISAEHAWHPAESRRPTDHVTADLRPRDPVPTGRDPVLRGDHPGGLDIGAASPGTRDILQDTGRHAPSPDEHFPHDGELRDDQVHPGADHQPGDNGEYGPEADQATPHDWSNLARKTDKIGEPAIHLDSVHPEIAKEFLQDQYPWLADLNNTGQHGYVDNCSHNVITVDRRLDGAEVSAAPRLRPDWPDQKVLGAADKEYRFVHDYETLIKELASREVGSRSVVYIGRRDETAHVFNAVNTEHGVVFLDGQSGTLGRLEPGVEYIGYLAYPKHKP
ncbi:toxin glutamine deamidase domain-containing protein [Streptomyces sp. NPDC021100]|uniref:toxin glutamine deamidase domain-containing protein n=1 Tax=Streptomyces sp. NPDC021100 TaxID=3365114 RepID=UPI003793EAC4